METSNAFKNCLKSVLVVGKEFLTTTSLHGFHWLIDAKRRETGKLYNTLALISWFFSVLLGLIFALLMMTLVWKRYAASPTITTIETNNYPISNVPFPGVTICNINAVYKPYADDVINKLGSYGVSQDKALMFLSNLSALVNFKEIDEEHILIFDVLVRMGYNASKLMLELAQPCKYMLKYCFLLGKSVPCRKLFRTTKSGFGYCCSFNYQALRYKLETETSLDEYFLINAPLIRTSGAGEDVSLRVILDVESHNYIAPKRFFYGTEIIIHDPKQYPEKSLLTAFGESGTDVSIAIRASVVNSVKEVQDLPIHLRNCKFGHEKHLQMTKNYSFHSCIMECRALTIIHICKCLPFFYPSITFENKSIQQCGLGDIKCLNNNKGIFSSLQTHFSKNNKDINGMSCDCLPSCNEQNYIADTFISNRVNGVGIVYTNDSVSNLSSLVVYFKDLSCIKYRRELFKTWDDFLASFGGIFGLCLGGSVMSLVEIVYFITFRIFWMYFNINKSEQTLENIRVRRRVSKKKKLINTKTKIKPKTPNRIFLH